MKSANRWLGCIDEVGNVTLLKLYQCKLTMEFGACFMKNIFHKNICDIAEEFISGVKINRVVIIIWVYCGSVLLFSDE